MGDAAAFADLRGRLAALAEATAEYAGLPLGIGGERLVVHPSYPWASVFDAPEEDPAPPPSERRIVRGSFYSVHRRCDVVIFECDGRIGYGLVPQIHHLDHDLRTLGCSIAWGLEQEARAIGLLGEHVPAHHLKQYLLTGMFLESSPRSGVTYLFRRLKPTVAVSFKTGEGRILAALCMHPIAYYAESWAGAMCPTDDVIAHLLLMRGDEALYWRRCTQHAPHRPEAGL